MVLSSNGTLAGVAGRVPVAMTNVLGADDLEVVGPVDVQDVVVVEPGRAPDQLDAVAVELVADEVQLVVDDLLADVDQVGDGDLALDAGGSRRTARAG